MVNMKRLRPECETGPSLTLGRAPTAHVRAIVWCEGCGHQIEPDAAELIEGRGEPVSGDQMGGPADIRRVDALPAASRTSRFHRGLANGRIRGICTLVGASAKVGSPRDSSRSAWVAGPSLHAPNETFARFPS